jgi:uroporphyrinogen decarboxylase
MNTGREQVIEQARHVLAAYGQHTASDKGHIFNLGHGIQPFAKPDNMQALVETLQRDSAAYHGND